MKEKFYICNHCGNVVGVIKDGGAPLVCCGEKMTALVPNTVEASAEKHLPVVTLDGGAITVDVGAITHPMEEKHYIEWIYVQTEKGGHRITFNPNDKPTAKICLCGDKAVAVYAYCNLHGLWMTKL